MPSQQEAVKEDFDIILRILPSGWQEKAKELGAVKRWRKIPDAETLLRILLIHLAEGCSLRETAVISKEAGLAHLSDVAILDRLRCAGAWFQWINRGLMENWCDSVPEKVYGTRWQIHLVDATCVKEPGPTGSSWRIHYKIGLPSLLCEEFHLARPKGDGESFKRFSVQAGDLFIGDRAYGVRPSICHVTSQGGEVLTRFAISNLPLLSRRGEPFVLLEKLRKLKGTQIADWPVLLRHDAQEVSGRVCAVRKSRQAAEQARKQVLRQAQKQGFQAKAETLEAADYVYVFTTLEGDELSARNVLEMYRGRWQVELVFKRLKSIMELGHLRKIDPESTKSWLQGKLLVAFLVESLLRNAESFFPWGYPLNPTPPGHEMPVA